MKKVYLSAIGMALVCALAGQVFAASAISSNLVVTATEPIQCFIQTNPINLGDFSATGNYGTGAISVNCTKGTAYDVTLDAGTHYLGSIRHLGSTGAAQIAYSLYKDASYTQEWGDLGIFDTYPAGSPVSGTGGDNYLVFAKTVPGANPSAGTYTDTVVVTVSY